MQTSKNLNNPFKLDKKAAEWGKKKFNPTERVIKTEPATPWSTFKNEILQKEQEEKNASNVDIYSKEAQEHLKKREKNFRKMLITEKQKEPTKWEEFTDDIEEPTNKNPKKTNPFDKDSKKNKFKRSETSCSHEQNEPAFKKIKDDQSEPAFKKIKDDRFHNKQRDFGQRNFQRNQGFQNKRGNNRFPNKDNSFNNRDRSWSNKNQGESNSNHQSEEWKLKSDNKRKEKKKSYAEEKIPRGHKLFKDFDPKNITVDQNIALTKQLTKVTTLKKQTSFKRTVADLKRYGLQAPKKIDP